MTDEQQWTTAELLTAIESGWNEFQAYLATLSPAQMTGPTDAAGWSVKDHVMHLAIWEKGIVALLKREDRQQAMGLDDDAWNGHDYDVMNAIIRDQHAGLSLDAVKQAFADIHGQLVARIGAMADADLQRPYSDYADDPGNDRPVVGYIVGNTFEHYAEHQPWIEKVVAG